jgi:hypothetical protein
MTAIPAAQMRWQPTFGMPEDEMTSRRKIQYLDRLAISGGEQVSWSVMACNRDGIAHLVLTV